VSGSCIQLDGIDDFINFNDTNDTMDLDDGNKGTLEIWVKVASWPTTGYPSIISKGTGGSGWSGGSYHISFWTGAIRFVIYSTTPLYDSTSTASLPSINTWHNLVLTWTGKNGGVLKGYVDGNAVNPTGTSQTQLANFRSGEALRIGRSSPDFFAGTVDEVRLYKNGISALQIKNNYYLGLNKLFFNGSIGKEEYLSRISEYAIK
jgi:hypothetical protein